MNDIAQQTLQPLTADEARALVARVADSRNRVLTELRKVVVGQEASVDLVLAALFAGGHCLLTGVPGLAKTLLVRTLAQILDLGFRRLQFTPDLMPTDITGTEVLDETDGIRALRFVRGPVFTQLQLADELPNSATIIVGALRALIGALAESGRLDEAWKSCQDLHLQVDENAMTQLAGEVAWVIGNVAFMRHDYIEGVKHHERAAKLLSPANDIELWARFNKASAAVRLSSGIVEPETLSSIERAELAFSIVSGTKADELEVAFIRARWLYLTGDIVAAVEKLREIHAERAALAKHTAGEVSLLLGKSLKAAGEFDEALAHLHEAQKAFSAAGAGDRVQHALDAVLEIRLAQQRAAGASKAG